jgi:hypothetical protein
MPERDDATSWMTSSFSGGNGCVAVARLADDRVGVRNSREPAGPLHVFTQHEWTAFLAGVKNGDFDHI